MKYVITLFAIIMNCYFSQAQIIDSAASRNPSKAFNKVSGDTTNKKHIAFSISTDLAQYALLQPNINFEYKISALRTLGVNFGQINPMAAFATNPVANGQFTDPGTVYRGYAIRLYIKIHDSLHPKRYWCIQGVYKSLYFNNRFFYDQYGDAYYSSYTMSENSQTTGLDVMRGYEFPLKDRHLDIDLFFGLGCHFRSRNYTINNESTNAPINNSGQPELPSEYRNDPLAKNGNFNDVVTIITPILGFKLGYNFLRKK